MKKFFKDLKRYNPYAMYAAKSELKSSVADSYLNWLWWILDPILFMLVYTFMVQIVFNTREDYFPVFVFIGLTAWDFFNRTMLNSVKLVRTNKAVVSKIYVPKYVLVLTKMYVNFFKMLISFGIVSVFMAIYGIKVGFNLLYIPLILSVLFVITFACSTIFMHFGVFIEDLSNVLTVLLRLLFYLSGIFYSIEKRIGKANHMLGRLILNLNPMALIINSLRNVMMYNKMPNLRMLFAWLVIGLALSVIGIKAVYKYENSYSKVI